MQITRIQTFFAIVLVVGSVALTLSLGPGTASVLASSKRSGRLHVTKECSQYTGAAGDFCTITSSNLAEIAVGSKVFYDQPAGIPPGLVDSNVLLDAGNGNRTVGRCTLDLATNLALCTLSDGTGQFTGFQARINGSGSFADYHWDGTYSFTDTGREHGD